MANNKQRISIPISGVDTSTPSINVQDGKCSKIHNLRYETNAWRIIQPLRVVYSNTTIPTYPEYDIVYHHPADAADRYVICTLDGNISILSIGDGQPQIEQSLCAISHRSALYISHFGKVLIISDTWENRILYFLLKNNKYTYIDTSARIGAIEIDSTYIANKKATYKDKNIPPYGTNMTCFQKLMKVGDDTIYYKQSDGNYWRGIIYWFAAARMSDGTIIAQTPLHCMTSEDTIRTVDKQEDLVIETIDNERFFCLRSFGAGIHDPFYKATAKIDISQIDKDICADIAIYTTKINPFFDPQKIRMKYEDFRAANVNLEDWDNPSTYPKDSDFIITDLREIFAHDDIVEQPFYFMDKVDVVEPEMSHVSFDFDFTKLKNVETNIGYTPLQFAHKLIFKGYKEYNNRGHFYNMTSILFSGYDAFNEMLTSSGQEQDEFGGALYPDESKFDSMITIIETADGEKNILTKLDNGYFEKPLATLCYPDFTASKIVLTDSRYIQNGHYTKGLIYKLKPATGINYAYAQPPMTNKVIIGTFPAPSATALTDISIPVKSDNVKQEPNRIQVSGNNNLFNLPYENSYNVGIKTAQILNVNSAAIEMSDAKFGEFPLYIFTSEGIFAMQSGTGEVLYSAVIPINYDVIVNQDTIAANYNVFYATQTGLHVLNSQQSKLISTSINLQDNQQPIRWAEAKFMYDKANQELIIWDSRFEDSEMYEAFVYSLTNQVWSTRDFKGVPIDAHQIYDFNSRQILSLDSQFNTEIKAIIKTREIKLGSTEYKRVESLIPRVQPHYNVGNDDYIQLSVSLYGSNDSKQWTEVRKLSHNLKNELCLRRTMSSWRFFQIELAIIINGNADISLTSLDLEYYFKFIHRLR